MTSGRKRRLHYGDGRIPRRRVRVYTHDDVGTGRGPRYARLPRRSARATETFPRRRRGGDATTGFSSPFRLVRQHPRRSRALHISCTSLRASHRVGLIRTVFFSSLSLSFSVFLSLLPPARRSCAVRYSRILPRPPRVSPESGQYLPRTDAISESIPQ